MLKFTLIVTYLLNGQPVSEATPAFDLAECQSIASEYIDSMLSTDLVDVVCVDRDGEGVFVVYPQS